MTKTTKPYSWPPSQYWEGADGNWSTFALRVGTPEQVVRVLPSTAGRDLWVVSPDGCLPDESGVAGSTSVSCEQSRGGSFNLSASASWRNLGIFEMELEKNLGYYDSAQYGSDVVALDLSEKSKGPVLESQLVGAYANNDYYNGMFGLGKEPTNFTNFQYSNASLLTTMRANGIIPSLSWAYTAGAHYRSTGIFGSLTFGGYEPSRRVYNNVSFPFAQDITRDLVVNLTAIKATFSNDTVNPLLPGPVLIFIDSTIPSIYLPIEACKRFEDAFEIVWNTTSMTYFIDDSTHQRLLAANPSITFELAPASEVQAPTTVEIVLPYASFDLSLEYPLVPSSRRYFPLVQAANDTQYTLGRAFLQEAYLITNYENQTFSIYQSKYGGKKNQHLVTIPAANGIHHQEHLGLGGMIGTGFGAAAVVLLVVTAVLFFRKYKQKVRSRGQAHGMQGQRAQSVMLGSQITNDGVHEIDMNSLIGLYRELPDSGRAELLDSNSTSGTNVNVAELAHGHLWSQDLAHELMTHHSSGPTTEIQEPDVRHDSGILISTEILRKSFASVDESSRVPRVETAISSSNSYLNRSLPPTPISDSPQVSPRFMSFHDEQISTRVYTSALRDSPIVGSVHGIIAEYSSPISPYNSITNGLPKRLSPCLTNPLKEMEIAIPPDIPRFMGTGLETIQPLKINKKVGKRKRNFL